MNVGFQIDDALRRAAVKVMGTDAGKELYGGLLSEWERLCVNSGKAQTNDLLRQFIGQAEGVRWVIEMLAGAQAGGGANANAPLQAVSPAKAASDGRTG